MKEIYGDANIFCLLLYDCLNNPSEEMMIFTGMIFSHEVTGIKSYYLKYFKDIIDKIIVKKNTVLKEKLKLMKSKDGYTFVDDKGIEVLLVSDKYSNDIVLMCHNANWLYEKEEYHLNNTEMYKKGYVPPLKPAVRSF